MIKSSLHSACLPRSSPDMAMATTKEDRIALVWCKSCFLQFPDTAASSSSTDTVHHRAPMEWGQAKQTEWGKRLKQCRSCAARVHIYCWLPETEQCRPCRFGISFRDSTAKALKRDVCSYCWKGAAGRGSITMFPCGDEACPVSLHKKVCTDCMVEVNKKLGRISVLCFYCADHKGLLEPGYHTTRGFFSNPNSPVRQRTTATC